MDLGGRTNQETESTEVLMQWLQGSSGTATPQIGILSSKSRYFQEPFTIISTGCVGQTRMALT